MNKKEISEIKKQFTPDRCSITRICGCYVDGETNEKKATGSFVLCRSYQQCRHIRGGCSDREQRKCQDRYFYL